MFLKKMAAFLTGAVVLALALPVLAASQAPEKTADAEPVEAQEAAETEQPDKPRATEAVETDAPEATPPSTMPPDNTPPARREKVAADGSLSIYMDGKNLTGGAALINWPDLATPAPTAVLKAVGPDGSVVSPVYASSDDGVVYVDESGLVTAVGYGVAVITATLDAQKAVVQVSVGHEVRRVVIIGEDSVGHGRSVKLRAFDQDGSRINVIWRSSSEKLASVNSDGVVTAGRRASGQSVEITAFADEALTIYAVKSIQID
jgi:hypothetical protein